MSVPEPPPGPPLPPPPDADTLPSLALDDATADTLVPPARSFLLRSAVLVAAATLLSRILGLGREGTITYLFRPGYETDAFYMAYAIPDIVRVLILSGILSAIFIPLYAEVAAQQGLERAKKMAGQFLTLTMLVGGTATLLGILTAPWVIGLTQVIAPPTVAPDPRLIPLAILLTRLLFPMLLFTGLSGLLQSVFNSLHDYRTPAFAPIWFNLVFIVLLLGAGTFAPQYMTAELMAYASVLGMMTQVVVQLPGLRRHGITFARPDLRDPHWRKFAGLVPAAFAGYAALVTNSFVDRSFAFGLGDAVTTAQYLSIRLQQLPNGIIAITLVTALFPTVAQKLSLGRKEEAMEDLYLALRLAATALLPAAIFLIVWATPVVRLLFNRGEFAEVPGVMALTSAGVMAYAMAIFPLGAGVFTTRTFFAVHDRRTPVILGLSAIVINYTCDYVFTRVLGYGLVGIALSSLVVATYVYVGGLLVLQQRFPMMRRWWFRHETLRVAILAVVYAAVAYAGSRGIESLLPLIHRSNTTTPELADVVYLAGAGLLSLLVLLGASVLLHVEEVQLLRRLGQRRRAATVDPGLPLE